MAENEMVAQCAAELEEMITDKLADDHDFYITVKGCNRIVSEIVFAMARREADGHEKIADALVRRRRERTDEGGPT